MQSMDAGQEPSTSYRSLGSGRNAYLNVRGTAVLALKYRDGILMAADMGGSTGPTLAYKTVERIKAIGQHSLLECEWRDNFHDDACDDGNSLGPKEMHNFLARVMYDRCNKFNPLRNLLVLGGVKNGEKYLGVVNMIGEKSEYNYVATETGNDLALPILRKEWNENLCFGRWC
ncbi:hypothetical protein NL676_022831 [Syzygium grande]|nr:hypothetical protein NL676_022831 [Syzygium grande]